MMKSILKIALLQFSLVIFTSCKKEDGSLNSHTVVEGKLLDAATLEPVSGGMVILRKGYNYREIDTAVTGSNGYYSFDFVQEESYIYSVTARADRYLSNSGIANWAVDYSTGKPSPVQYIDVDHHNQIDIKLPPEGFVRYHFKQVQPYNGNIEIRFIPYNKMSVIVWNGQGLDKEYMDRRPGGADQIIGSSIIWNNDSVQSFTDTLFVPRFDTLNYTIEY